VLVFKSGLNGTEVLSLDSALINGSLEVNERVEEFLRICQKLASNLPRGLGMELTFLVNRDVGVDA